MLFQPTYPYVHHSHEKVTITALNFKDIINFFLKGSKLMTCFTYFKVMYQSHIHIQDKGVLTYQVKWSHIHISFMNQQEGLRSTTSRHTIHHITYSSFKYQVGTLSLPHKIPHQHIKRLIITYHNHASHLRTTLLNLTHSYTTLSHKTLLIPLIILYHHLKNNNNISIHIRSHKHYKSITLHIFTFLPNNTYITSYFHFT